MAENKYARGKIYKICGGDELYIGSTVEPYLSNRFDGHKSHYKRWLVGKGALIRSYTLFEKYGVENCKIELVEAFPCNDINELRAREGYWIRQGCVNKCIVGRTVNEYHKEHAEKYKEYWANYRNENAEKAREYNAKYRKEHAEKLAIYEKQRAEERKKKIVCECGMEIRKSNMSIHLKTKKHQVKLLIS